MCLQIFLTFAAFQLSIASHPVIFQKDNSVIAIEPMKVSHPQQHTFIPVDYPHYEVITNQAAAPPLLSKSDSLPADLIQIAATKLGIKNLSQIPSVSELAELLGTETREETIDTIRQLTATESGIDLIKAFIESSDYTDNTVTTEEPIQIKADTSGPSLLTSLLSETAQKDLELLQKIVSTPKPELGFFQRASAYLNFFDLFPENKDIPISPVNEEVQQIKPRSHKYHHVFPHQNRPKLQPLLGTPKLPREFPVPYIPGVGGGHSKASRHKQNPVAVNENRHHLTLNRPILEDRYLN